MKDQKFKPLKYYLTMLLVLVIGLPASLLLMFADAPKAQAATKPKVVSEPEKPVVSKMSFVGQPRGLHRGNTYVTGQSISMTVSVSGEPSLVWGKIGALDSNFPETIYLQNQGEGNWFLKTPKLSSDLNIGSYTIKLFAQAIDGKTIQTQTKITLQQFQAATVLSYKVSADGTANIDWESVNWADVYLVNWQIQGDNASNIFKTSKSPKIIIENLEPGTFYEVRIQPLRGDAVGPPSKVIFKTLGQTPIKLVAGEKETVATTPVQKITPAIDEGVSTSREVTRATSKVSGQVTPPKEEVSPQATPTASPAPIAEEKTKAGGWNKLLIALSILIIAAGVAIGGYYGYEWLMLKSHPHEPPEEDSSSRW